TCAPSFTGGGWARGICLSRWRSTTAPCGSSSRAPCRSCWRAGQRASSTRRASTRWRSSRRCCAGTGSTPTPTTWPSDSSSALARLAVGGGEDAVEIGAAIAEEAPGGARPPDGGEVEGRGDDALVGAPQLGDLVPARVGDERRAVEDLPRLVAD